MFRPRIVPLRGLARPLAIQPRIVITRRLQSTEAAIPPTAPPPPPPKAPRRSHWRTFFRYSMRAIYLSALGGIGFFIYRMIFKDDSDD